MDKAKKNIVLIGMPGSGKSTLGRMLAEKIGYGFIDSDSVICARVGLSLREIIEREGLDGFLRIEGKVNAELSAERCVIATGGSVVYSSEAMNRLKAMGAVVYLQLSYESVARRLSDLKGRGVAIKEGFTLKDLYDERTPLYEKYADVTVSLEGGDSRSRSVARVAEALKR